MLNISILFEWFVLSTTSLSLCGSRRRRQNLESNCSNRSPIQEWSPLCNIVLKQPKQCAMEQTRNDNHFGRSCIPHPFEPEDVWGAWTSYALEMTMSKQLSIVQFPEQGPS